MRKFAFLVIVSLIAMRADAAATFRLELHREGWPEDSLTNMQVTVDRSNVRVDFERAPDEVVTHHTAISRDGGKTFVAMNNDLRTWFRLDASPFVLRPSALAIASGNEVLRDIKWSMPASDRGPDGPTHHRQLSYVVEERFEGVRVRVRCTVTVKIWATPELGTTLWPGHVAFATGIPTLDEEIASRVELLQEFPERIVLVATKQFDGGSPSTETLSMRVVQVAPVGDVAPDLFEMPRGYIEQRPVIAAPGS